MKRPPIPPEQWVFRDARPGDWAVYFGELKQITRIMPKIVAVGAWQFRRDTGDGWAWCRGKARPATPEEIEAHESRIPDQKKTKENL